jgi:uncharacterized membrane protein
MPTSGYFLMVPEDEVTELNWDFQETVQAIISGGLTAPAEVTYYGSRAGASGGSMAGGSTTPPRGQPRTDASMGG